MEDYVTVRFNLLKGLGSIPGVTLEQVLKLTTDDWFEYHYCRKPDSEKEIALLAKYVDSSVAPVVEAKVNGTAYVVFGSPGPKISSGVNDDFKIYKAFQEYYNDEYLELFFDLYLATQITYGDSKQLNGNENLEGKKELSVILATILAMISAYVYTTDASQQQFIEEAFKFTNKHHSDGITTENAYVLDLEDLVRPAITFDSHSTPDGLTDIKKVRKIAYEFSVNCRAVIFSDLKNQGMGRVYMLCHNKENSIVLEKVFKDSDFTQTFAKMKIDLSVLKGYYQIIKAFPTLGTWIDLYFYKNLIANIPGMLAGGGSLATTVSYALVTYGGMALTAAAPVGVLVAALSVLASQNVEQFAWMGAKIYKPIHNYYEEIDKRSLLTENKQLFESAFTDWTRIENNEVTILIKQKVIAPALEAEVTKFLKEHYDNFEYHQTRVKINEVEYGVAQYKDKLDEFAKLLLNAPQPVVLYGSGSTGVLQSLMNNLIFEPSRAEIFTEMASNFEARFKWKVLDAAATHPVMKSLIQSEFPPREFRFFGGENYVDIGVSLVYPLVYVLPIILSGLGFARWDYEAVQKQAGEGGSVLEAVTNDAIKQEALYYYILEKMNVPCKELTPNDLNSFKLFDELQHLKIPGFDKGIPSRYTFAKLQALWIPSIKKHLSDIYNKYSTDDQRVVALAQFLYKNEVMVNAFFTDRLAFIREADDKPFFIPPVGSNNPAGELFRSKIEKQIAVYKSKSI